jgi:hypothetical protein
MVIGFQYMNEIYIVTADITLKAALNDSSTSKKVWEALPIEAKANVWGDEIYSKSLLKCLKVRMPGRIWKSVT